MNEAKDVYKRQGLYPASMATEMTLGLSAMKMPLVGSMRLRSRRDGGDRDLVLQADLAQVGGGGCDGDDAQAVEKHVFAQK